MVYGNENDILAEDVDLEGKYEKCTAARKGALTFFVHLANRPFSYPSDVSFDQKNVLK